MNKYQVKAVGYILIYLLATPFCLLLTLCLVVCCTITKRLRETAEKVTLDKAQRRTVLIAGLTISTKALHICQILGKAGHHVILAEQKSRILCSTRFSTYVTKVYNVPDVAMKSDWNRYISSLLNIAEKEDIDWYIPVSAADDSLLHVFLAEKIKDIKPSVKCLASAGLAQVALLDDKVSFQKECRKLGFSVPECYEIQQIEDIFNLNRQGIFQDKHFFLKPLAPYDEDREDFTRIPHDEKKLKDFTRVYESKIRTDRPYFASEFIKGKEFSANVICSQGETFAFHVNPSSSIQVNYEEVKHTAIKNWTLELCKTKKLTGIICFDFIEEEQTGKVYCIECNPRPSSSIVSYNRSPKVEAVIRLLLEQDDNKNVPSLDVMTHLPLSPDKNAPHFYWLYNEIGKVFTRKQGLNEFIHVLWTGKEAVYMTDDPVPFFMANTFQMIEMLVRIAINGKPFRIPSHCLGKPF